MNPEIQRVVDRSLGMSGVTRGYGTWGRGLLLRGLLAVGELDVVRQSLSLALDSPSLDSTQTNCSPIWTAVLQHPHRERRTELFMEAVAYARSVAGPNTVRAPGGAISHLAWPSTIWSDTPFMVGPLLAKCSLEVGDSTLGREAADQVMLHIEALRDGPTGLLKHSVWPKTPWVGDEALWARGNGWVLAAAAEVMDLLGIDECEPLAQQARDLVQPLVERQSASGLWPVVLDDPSSPLESSCAALVGRAILTLHRLGVLDEQHARAGHRAVRAVLDCVADDGTVGRSQGPTIWASATPVGGCWPWTQGLTLLMGAELARHA